MQSALVLASCLVVPLLFSLAQRDIFALTKITALQIVAVAGIFLLFARRAFLGTGTSIVSSRLHVTVIVLVLLNLVACIFSVDPFQSLWGEDLQHQGFLSLLLYVGFFYLAHTSLTDERRLVLLFASIAAGATIVAAYAVLQRAHLDPIWSDAPLGRTFSTIGQPNALAAYLVVAIPVSAALLPRIHWPMARALAILAVGLMGAALASTKSRAGYIGCLAACAILIVPLLRALKPRRPSIRNAFLTGLSILTVVVLLLPSIRETVAAVSRRALSSADLQETSVRRHLDLRPLRSRLRSLILSLEQGKRRSQRSFHNTQRRSSEPTEPGLSMASGRRALITSTLRLRLAPACLRSRHIWLSSPVSFSRSPPVLSRRKGAVGDS